MIGNIPLNISVSLENRAFFCCGPKETVTTSIGFHLTVERFAAVESNSKKSFKNDDHNNVSKLRDNNIIVLRNFVNISQTLLC